MTFCVAGVLGTKVEDTISPPSPSRKEVEEALKSVYLSDEPIGGEGTSADVAKPTDGVSTEVAKSSEDVKGGTDTAIQSPKKPKTEDVAPFGCTCFM